MSNTETGHSYRNANATHYDEQAQALLDRFGIKFRATLSDSKVAPWATNSPGGHHYRVTLSKSIKRDGGLKHVRHAMLKPTRLTFDFWGCIADAEKGIKTVTPYDVLACISSDAIDTEYTSFGEWCDNYEFDRDSIKALQTYRCCSAFAKRLQAFFTKEEIEALQEIQ